MVSPLANKAAIISPAPHLKSVAVTSALLSLFNHCVHRFFISSNHSTVSGKDLSSLLSSSLTSINIISFQTILEVYHCLINCTALDSVSFLVQLSFFIKSFNNVSLFLTASAEAVSYLLSILELKSL